MLRSDRKLLLMLVMRRMKEAGQGGGHALVATHIVYLIPSDGSEEVGGGEEGRRSNSLSIDSVDDRLKRCHHAIDTASGDAW